MKKSVYLYLLAALIVSVLIGSCVKTPSGREEVVPPKPGVLQELKVAMAAPMGKVEEQSELDTISVSFNQPMAPLSTVPKDESSGPLQFEPKLYGKYRWLGTATLAFTPSEPLPPGINIKATVPAGTKSLSGADLKKDFTWSFETLRPILRDCIPENGRKWVSLGSSIFLRFNQPMDPAKATGKSELSRVDEKGHKTIVPCKITSAGPDDFVLTGAWKDEKPEHVLKVTPESPMEPGGKYRLEIKSGMKAKSGDLGTEKIYTIAFSTQNVFAFNAKSAPRSLNPESELSLLFTNPVYVKDLAAHIKFSPAVKIPGYYEEYDYDTDSPELYLDFAAQTVYQVTISGAMKDIFGNTLGHESSFSFKTTDFDPSLEMSDGNGVIESVSKRLLPVGFMNMEKVGVKMAKVPVDSVIPLHKSLAMDYDRDYNPGGSFYTVDRTWNVNPPKNEKTFMPLQLDDALKGSTAGLLFVQLDTLKPIKYTSRYQKVFLQVTNLGVTGKFSPENNLIWVTTLNDAKWVRDAEVEIRSDSNKVLWKGRTDEKGVAKTPGWAALGLKKIDRWDTPTVWVFAKKGSDAAFINSAWNWGISGWAFNVDYAWSQEAREFAAALFTERGLYRRGDEVNIKGTFREKKRGAWKISSIKSVNLKVFNSRDEELFKGNVKLSRFGSFNKTLKIPDNAPTGDCRMELWYALPGGQPEQLASESFMVEDFKPADFKVTVDSRKKSYVFQDTFEGDVKGTYLFGAPMSGDKVSWRFRISPYDFTPPGYDGFSFGPMYDEEIKEPEALLGTGEGKLDSKGTIGVHVPLKAEDVRQTMQLTVEGSVKSTDRTELSGTGAYIVHKGDYYIGLKPRSTFISSKEKQGIEVIAVSPEGEKKSGESIKVEIYKRIWHSVRKVGVGGREWVTEKKDEKAGEFDIKSNSTQASIDFSPDKAGYYVVKAYGVDRRQNKILTETSFYVSGSDYVAWPRQEDNIVELIKDKNEYKPGETARIIVKSPYEKATALVTWEREYVIDHKIVEVKGSADVITAPIKAGDLPNVFVSVVLIQGRVAEEKFSEYGEDLGKPSFRIGYINLPVVSEEKKLTISLKTDKEVYKPQEEVTLKLKLQDYKGRPAPGEICLAAVDEGVLSLINYKTPNFYPDFYGPRPLVVENSESRLHVIGQRDYGEKGENSGGGGGRDFSSIDLRTEFKSTAYWNPSIIINKSGEAEVRFKLPDNLTTFRLMAVAQTENASFGSAEKGIIVRKPLLLKEACPRFVRLKDAFKAGITVFNGTPTRGSVDVNLECKGFVLDGPALKTVDIEAGQEKEVLFAFRSETLGDGELGFRAALGTETDGLKVKIPVKEPICTEATATSGTTDKGSAKEKLSLPVGIMPTVGALYLNMSSTAMVDLKGGVNYLVYYPYECLEQKLSKILPALMAQDLVEAFDLSANLKGKAYREFIQGYLDYLARYQKSSGGFGLWEDSLYENEYLSCYALYALAMAKKAGYHVDEKEVKSGLQFVRSLLSRSEADPWNLPYDEKERLVVKSFALYDLFLWKEGDPSYLTLLYEKRDDMTLFGRALLLKSLHMNGKNHEQEEEIIQHFKNKLKLTPTDAHFEEAQDREYPWIFDSTVRTTALILQTLLEVDAEFADSYKVVKWLVRSQKMGRWDTTQENVYAFDALRTYFHKFEHEVPNYTAKAELNGKKVMEEAFRGRELRLRETKIPMNELTPGKEMDVKFNKSGKGRMYYTMRLIYADSAGVKPRDEGIAVLKTIQPVDQSSLSDNIFQAGGVYKVTLSIVTPQERTFVVVDDPLPGGFVVVNTSFAAEKAELGRKMEKMRSSEMHGKWGTTFDHWELYDDRVLLFADVLSAGEHCFTYFVRAQYFGTYDIPASKAEMMYQPEVYGISDKRSIEIK